MADDYGLSEMREEHQPRRVTRGETRVLTWIGHTWTWHHRESNTHWETHPDDAHQSIDAARRKALHKAGFSVRDFPSSEGVYLIFVPDWPDGPESRHDSLRAAYAAVFPKGAARAE